MTDVAAASDQPSLSLSAVEPAAEPPVPKPDDEEVDDNEKDKEEEDGEGDDYEEEEEDGDDDDDEEEAVDEEGEPDYIWLSPAEFNDPNLPYLLGAPANPKSTRTHSRRQKSAESLFPHLSDTLYRCKEYPHGIYVNSFGQLCPDDKRSGLYQIDERAAENDKADDALERAEDAVAAQEAGLEEEDDDDDDDEEEDKDNDDAPPDARDVTWVDAENKIRAKKGLKRKKVVPDEDEDDYQPESGEEEEDDDKPSEEGDAEEMETDDEFQDEELEGTDDDHEWDPAADKKEHDHGAKKKKAKTADDEDAEEDDEDEDDDDEEEDRDSQGRPLPREADEYEPAEPKKKDPKEPKVVLTAEQQKEAFLKSMKAAEESQDQMNKAADLRQRQRIQDQKNLRLLENWSEEWKKIRGKIFREEKASETDPELRKKIKNTSITMTFEAHILSKTDPGCDFVFRKPVLRPKKGEVGPKPVPLPPIAATFDCTTSEVICGLCTRRFSQMMGLYRHLAEHFMELKIRAELKAATPAAPTSSVLSTMAQLGFTFHPDPAPAPAPPAVTIIHNVF